MEKYVVNGVEFTYDTFELENVDAWEKENRRVQEVVEEMGRNTRQEGGAVDSLREGCYAILDFFDAVVGEGTARSVFGERVNVRDIFAGYQSFSQQVTAQMQGVNNEICGAAPNRAMRRATPHTAR